MKMELGYGKGEVSVEVDDSRIMGILEPSELKGTGLTERQEIERALAEPVNSERLGAIVRPGEKIAVITSDITRPCPSYKVLPPLLEELSGAGVKDEDVTVVFALGSHRRHTEEEMVKLVGEDIYKRYSCIDLDVDDCVSIGKTGRGTPVAVSRPVVEADKRICVGNIEYHYFAGYSGGAKAILPGVCTKDAIQANHSMMVRDDAKTGTLESNPLRCDIDEVGELISIDFILNVVLDPHKKILKAVAGHYIDAHREGCRFLDSLYKIPLKEAAPVVVVSPGGFPKDLNIYQAQKALDNARHAVRQGGVIIWVASCSEGFGSAVFERWMTGADSPDQIIEDIQANFELGGHKAAAIAMTLKKASIFLVSDLDPELVRSIFLTPFATVEEALQEADRVLGKDSKILLMPYGGSTLPVLEKEE
jgi:nickel-dependent lactate racemase